jgi:hypothetical protein
VGNCQAAWAVQADSADRAGSAAPAALARGADKTVQAGKVRVDKDQADEGQVADKVRAVTAADAVVGAAVAVAVSVAPAAVVLAADSAGAVPAAVDSAVREVVEVAVPVAAAADLAARAEADRVEAAKAVGAQAVAALAPAAARLRGKEVRVAKRVQNHRQPSRGMTLLELILALALSVLVLMAIGMAMDIHYRMFDVRRTSIEETHVARAALRSIADDLRTAVQYIPPDLSGLDTVTGNTIAATATAASNAVEEATGGIITGGATGGTGGATGQTINADGSITTTGPMGFGTPTPGGQTGNSTQSGSAPTGVQGFGTGGTFTGDPAAGAATGETEATSELGTPITVVGLYGSTGTLQFDMSRLPRVDEYETLYSANSELGVVDIPSDIKTVTYFVCTEDSFGGAKDPGLMSGSPTPSVSGRGRGLMRRELSQAVASWAEANGNLNATYADAKLLADEVVGLQFRYYDGVDWLDDWNSDDLGGLPFAVEITVTIQPTYAMSEDALAQLAVDEMPPEKSYSLIVHLPAAQAAAAATTEVVDTAAGDSAVLEEGAP